MTYKYGRGRNKFAKTSAYEKYMHDNKLTKEQLGALTGDRGTDARNWIYRGSVPKVVLQKLGIKYRNGKASGGGKSAKQFPDQGSLYTAYVPGRVKDLFEGLCKELGIDTKFVL